MVLRTDGSVPFPFGKDGSGILANCFFCGTKATLFSAGSVCSSFSTKPAPFCILFAGLSSTNKSAISFLFLFYLTLLHLSFYFKLCGRSGRNCLLFPVLSGYDGSPKARFSRGRTLARRGALLAPSAIPCSLSPLISGIQISNPNTKEPFVIIYQMKNLLQ